MEKLRLMSNNIWKNDENQPAWEAEGEDCSALHRAKGFARVYLATKPDVLGLQESSPLMADEIMAHLTAAGEPYALLWGKDTPVIYRTDKFELVDSEFCMFPESIPDLEGRFNNHKTKSYCIAVLRTKEEGKLLLFATVHLWWKSEDPASKDYYPGSDAARDWQVKKLIERLEEYREKYHCPAVFLGDMNAAYAAPAIQTALRCGYVHGHDAAVEYKDETNGHHYCYTDGYQGYQPTDFFHAIDHVFVKGAPKGFVRRFDRYYPDDYMALSDHFPMWIDVEY